MLMLGYVWHEKTSFVSLCSGMQVLIRVLLPSDFLIKTCNNNNDIMQNLDLSGNISAMISKLWEKQDFTEFENCHDGLGEAWAAGGGGGGQVRDVLL